MASRRTSKPRSSAPTVIKLPSITACSDIDGQWMVYDVVIDNVSLVNNYRSQFERVIAKSSVQDLPSQNEKPRFVRASVPERHALYETPVERLGGVGQRVEFLFHLDFFHGELNALRIGRAAI